MSSSSLRLDGLSLSGSPVVPEELVDAAGSGNLTTVSSLLTAGADPSAASGATAVTALHKVIMLGRFIIANSINEL